MMPDVADARLKTRPVNHRVFNQTAYPGGENGIETFGSKAECVGLIDDESMTNAPSCTEMRSRITFVKSFDAG